MLTNNELTSLSNLFGYTNDAVIGFSLDDASVKYSTFDCLSLTGTVHDKWISDEVFIYIFIFYIFYLFYIFICFITL